LVTWKKGGYYVGYAGGYKILVVNTVLYYNDNKKTKSQQKDIAD